MYATAIQWRDEEIPRFVLGTAQLGVSGYGVANRTGAIGNAAAASLIQAAWRNGVRFYDTAQGYGDSEAKLGAALRSFPRPDGDARIITKLDPGLNPADLVAIRSSIETTLSRLGDEPWGIMLHRYSWLDHWDDGLGVLLRSLRDDNRLKHLGVSVYEPGEALRALDHPDMEIIQVPANAWDRRMTEAGVFEKAREKGKLIFVRSVFLQGLLLLSPEEAEAKVAGSGKPASAWLEICRRHVTTPFAAALRWAATLNAPLVIGAETPGQVDEIAGALRDACDNDELLESLPEMNRVASREVVNPVLWRR